MSECFGDEGCDCDLWLSAFGVVAINAVPRAPEREIRVRNNLDGS